MQTDKPESSVSSNPFDKFESDVNEEQLETWNQMMNQVKGLVQMSDDEVEDEEVLIDDSLLVATSGLEIDIPELRTAESDGGGDREEMATHSTSGPIPTITLDTACTVSVELTLQYLTGKISFLEFSEAMERMNQAQTNEQGDEMEAVTEGGTETEGGAEEESLLEEEEDLMKDVALPKRKGKEPVRRKAKKRRRKCELPKLLEKSMGEAVMTFAKGNHELAIEQCLEIIRQAPEACKPFQVLGTIYEDMGDIQKSLQYSLIAAYLDPSDTEEWARLAEMCVEQNDFNQAIKCYTQAIAQSGENKMHCLWERSRLYEVMKEHKKALEGYQTLLPMFSKEDSEKYFKLAWAITRTYHEQGEKMAALDTIQKAFKDHPQQITAEDVNLLLELQIPEKLYAESLQVFVKHCGVTFTLQDNRVWSSDTEIDIDSIQNAVFSGCAVPDMLPVDLRCKLAVCLIHLKQIPLIKTLIAPLFEEDIEDYGDLYLDIAEAYMENSESRLAEPLLKKLVHSANYSLAAVWLRYGECLKAQGDVHGAVRAYSKVVTMAPSHIGARMSLSALQQQLGKHDEALEALEHEEIAERKLTREEQQMLLQKCHLLHAQGKLDEFLINAKQLLFQEWREVEAEDMSYLQAIRTYKHRTETLLNHFDSKGKDTIKLGSHLKFDRRNGRFISFEDLWDIFKTLSETLIAKKRYADFEEISLLGMLCPSFNQDEKIIADFEWFILTASILAKNTRTSYPFGRHFVLQNLENNQAWNMFIQVIMICNDTRHIRFCLRKMLQEPNNIALGILNGHNSMASGSYKHSLGEYANVFRRTPTDPLLSLCIGLDFLHAASQRFAAKRHYLVTQAIAFLNNYMELRGRTQETYYNLGRALHQINILYAAVHYYMKALAMPPCAGEKGGKLDLSKEAAYNLALIYQHSGSMEYAKYLLYKYCVI